MSRRVVCVSWILLSLACGGTGVSFAQEARSLGELAFPTSATGEAQRRFLIGVKLLHNFEYEAARTVFQDCQRIDPQFAMAYWGEAMCANHPLWDEQDLKAGQAVLKRLADVSIEHLTARERGILQALKILYGEGHKQTRDRRYQAALAELARQFPRDHEIACFHALAILGTLAGDRETRVYMRAAGVLEQVYQENPRHPGVLHYLIHCYDDPEHAPLGLRAARSYGQIAGDSAHAKHMPSHIYLALGMWDETIAANEAAWQAGLQRLTRLRLDEAGHDIHALHALQWLQYGYLQKGDYARGWELLEQIAEIHRRRPTAMCKWYFAFMQAAYVVDAPDWRRAHFEIDMEGVELSASASYLFARGLAALRHDTTGAEAALEGIIKLRSAAEVHIRAGGHHHSSYFESVYPSSVRTARIVETQLDALIRLADGETVRAISRLKDAASAEERLTAGYGPPVPVKPSHELLADVLLNLGRLDEAKHYYLQTLDRMPRRTAALAGLAQIAEERSPADAPRHRAAAELAENLGDQQPYQAWRELPRAKSR